MDPLDEIPDPPLYSVELQMDSWFLDHEFVFFSHTLYFVLYVITQNMKCGTKLKRRSDVKGIP